MTHLLYRSYAKVNLSLEIVGKREDGFHDLVSLVHAVNLADELHIAAAHELVARIEGLDLEPEENLIWRAAQRLAEVTRQRRGADLTLLKRIPAAAGLGGGSSDAATTLVGLNRLWGLRAGYTQLEQLAAELGSDVPFFVRGGAALMRGRGDDLEPLPPLPRQWLVLVVPEHSVADKTRRLYDALQPADYGAGDASARVADRLRRGARLSEELFVNGFARAARAVFPGLTETWEMAEQRCERRFFLSGAGPALFALAADRADARRQADRLLPLGLTRFAVRMVKHARVNVRDVAVASFIGYP